VVVAPARARRPGAGAPRVEDETAEEREACPFCEGREDRTPPETAASAADPSRAPDTPGWTVRVVPNLYPAFERQEVVVHGPTHVRSLAELAPPQLGAVAQMWEERAEAARAEGFPYVHALVNEGRAAGASLPHSHSQLVWLREPPPAVQAERVDGLAAILARRDLVIAEADGWRLFAHPAGRSPYELLVVGEPGAGLTPALVLLREAVERLRAVEGPVPWNAWLHAGERRHLHVLPRLSVQAGVELGAEIYVNEVAPEDAAAALREAGAV
jgi:UDPglucose--hexose-1-phosphate uridylyltransferase